MLLNDAEIERYARQVVMPEIARKGKNYSPPMSDFRGGRATPVIAGLAGAGIGNLTIIDDDKADITNLNRQFIHRCSTCLSQSRERRQFLKA